MLDSYLLLQVKNLLNLVSYLVDIGFTDYHEMTLEDLDNLEFYLSKLADSLT